VSVDLKRLSKAISHALRHAPWLYELELDEQGWTDLECLVQALRGHRPQWREVGPEHIERIQQEISKQRFEVFEGRIRARYGHSLPRKLRYQASDPPAALFHGTSPKTLGVIEESGLKPMNRQFVHLSVDVATAIEVGRRKHSHPVILRVDAVRAASQGVAFYQGNEKTWLADGVPAAFLEDSGEEA
jgi:putative RNA 2'-phosphotransferase